VREKISYVFSFAFVLIFFAVHYTRAEGINQRLNMHLSARFLLIVVTPLILAACDPRPESQINPRAFLDKLMDSEGPKVAGVNDTLLTSAHQAEEKRQYARALQFYQQLLDKDPENLTYLIGVADSARRAGQYDQAIAQYDAILARTPNYPDALEGKGLCYLNKGEFDSASEHFTRVLAVDDRRWRTLNGVAILFVMKEDPRSALTYFEEALRIKPAEPTILNNAGLTFALVQDYGRAVDALNQASSHIDKTDPQKKRVDLNLALVYGLAGDMEHAEEVAARQLGNSALNNNMGFYAYLANNRELAKAYLNNAIAGSPVFYEKAWKNLEVIGGTKMEHSQRTPRSDVMPFAAYPPQDSMMDQAPVAAPIYPVDAGSGEPMPPVMAAPPPPPPAAITPPMPPMIQNSASPFAKASKPLEQPLPTILPSSKPKNDRHSANEQSSFFRPVSYATPLIDAPIESTKQKKDGKVQVFPAIAVKPELDHTGFTPVSVMLETAQRSVRMVSHHPSSQGKEQFSLVSAQENEAMKPSLAEIIPENAAENAAQNAEESVNSSVLEGEDFFALPDDIANEIKPKKPTEMVIYTTTPKTVEPVATPQGVMLQPQQSPQSQPQQTAPMPTVAPVVAPVVAAPVALPASIPTPSPTAVVAESATPAPAQPQPPALPASAPTTVNPTPVASATPAAPLVTDQSLVPVIQRSRKSTLDAIRQIF
jgi:Flp pilus assembly protein TadD